MWKKTNKTLVCDETNHTIHKDSLYFYDEETKECFCKSSFRAGEEDKSGDIRTPGSYIDNFMLTNPILDDSHGFGSIN